MTELVTNDIKLVFEGGHTVALDYAAPFTLKQTRGIDAYYVTILCSSVDQLPIPQDGEDGKRCGFIFRTPGQNPSSPIFHTWGGWVLLRATKTQNDSELWSVTFADIRHILQHKRASLSLNVKWPDGTWRTDSLNNGRPYDKREAAQAVVQSLGFSAPNEGFADLSPSQTIQTLTANLGNTKTGGFVHASWAEMIKPIVETMNADPIVMFDGNIGFRSRQGDRLNQLAQLRARARIEDSVQGELSKWEKPRRLRLGFECKVENAIERFPSTTTISNQSQRAIINPVNVMGKWEHNGDFFDPFALGALNVDDSSWSPIWEEMAKAGYIAFLSGSNAVSEEEQADTYIASHFMLPQIFPYTRTEPLGDILDDADTILKKDWFDSMIRNSWRRFYRIEFPANANANDAPLLRSLAGLKFGRLTAEGSVRSKGAVFADYFSELATPIYTAGRIGRAFSQTMNKDHPFDALIPAPFTAQFISEEGNELIFSIDPIELRRLSQQKIFLGLAANELSYGTYNKLVADDYMSDGKNLQFGNESTEQHLQFEVDYKFRCMVIGTLIQEPLQDNVPPEIEGRAYILERDLFADGGIDSIDYRSYESTANFGYSISQMQATSVSGLFPDTLLNEASLNLIADRIQSETKAQFEAGQSGGILTPGVSCPAAGIGTSGDIHEFSIVVGNPAPHAITSQYIFAPQAKAVVVDQEEIDGKPPSLLDRD